MAFLPANWGRMRHGINIVSNNNNDVIPFHAQFLSNKKGCNQDMITAFLLRPSA
jgi:hypothetical protein